MNLPTPEQVATHANCSPAMAAHFLRAVLAAIAEHQPNAFVPLAGDVSQYRPNSIDDPLVAGAVLTPTGEGAAALTILARAAVSALRLMCMNPTQRDHWRVNDDGTLWREPVAKLGAYNRAVFNATGVIEDAPPPAP